jgi:FtsP/CotA-like multicopper oxidase with cupredoxin domain
MTYQLDRRQFLAAGAAIAGATLLGPTGCTPDRIIAPTSDSKPDAIRNVPLDGDLPEPPVIASTAGILTAAITCSTNPVVIGGRRVREPVTYNGMFPGPTLSARPGDMIDITFTNRIVFDQADSKPGYGRPPRESNMTNMHFHGMHVSPLGTADNMLIMVRANGKQRYLFQVPLDHPAGLFWYHAHVHGLVTNHVGRGAAGMIYISNAYTDQIESMGIRRRLMMLQQAYLDDDQTTLISDDGERDNSDLALSLINGELMPDILMRPGEPQVWSLLNGSTSAFYVLRLEGHTFDVIADDGTPLRTPRVNQETLLMPSGKRLEVVVRATSTKGKYTLSYDAHFQGVDTWPQKSVATVIVKGKDWTGPSHPGVESSTSLADLSLVTVPDSLKRTIVFAQNDNVAEGEFGRFTMNGHPWDPAISEWTSTLGTTEEWFIRNDTGQDHPFHVHVNPFQIVAINGAPVTPDGAQDVAIVPRFGSMTVRTRLADFVGGPVLMHCHILDHEDMGMMTRFEIAGG